MPNVDQERLNQIHQYWNAANYLTIGQIYLKDNPLLKEPLRPEHIKPRLLGHWGTSPGLSFIYVHLNRLIQDEDVNMIYLAGPGHGGPAILANVYLEGTYTQTYPESTARSIRRSLRIGRVYVACFASFRPLEGSLATSVCPPQAPFTKEASWVMFLRTPLAPHSTTPI